MSTIFTFPGKLGDALLQWPVAYQYATSREKQITLWLDEGTLKPLVNLFRSQAMVEAVELRGGVKNYTCGGQPFHFDLKPEEIAGHTVYHLGFRAFPQRQITLQTALDCGFDVDRDRLVSQRSLDVPCFPPPDPFGHRRRLVLHGTFQSHMSGTPRFWRWLHDHREDLERRFEEIVFVGTEDELHRAHEVYPDWGTFSDGGDFLNLARLIMGSQMVAGAGSSVVALAGALKVPCVRVHDFMADAPKMIWSNLGDNQLNETEIRLRELWPEFADRWAAAPQSSAEPSPA